MQGLKRSPEDGYGHTQAKFGTLYLFICQVWRHEQILHSNEFICQPLSLIRHFLLHWLALWTLDEVKLSTISRCTCCYILFVARWTVWRYSELRTSLVLECFYHQRIKNPKPASERHRLYSLFLDTEAVGASSCQRWRHHDIQLATCRTSHVHCTVAGFLWCGRGQAEFVLDTCYGKAVSAFGTRHKCSNWGKNFLRRRESSQWPLLLFLNLSIFPPTCSRALKTFVFFPWWRHERKPGSCDDEGGKHYLYWLSFHRPWLFTYH